MAYFEKQAQCATLSRTSAISSTFYARCIGIYRPIGCNPEEWSSFLWKPLHQVCMDNIKALACKTPILRPIDPSSDEPIWVICDALASGIEAVYGQGQTWQTCRPAGFMSKKFTGAQMNYRVFEMETIAILEALLKWEDKLIGNRLNVITDHRALEFFKTQRQLSVIKCGGWNILVDSTMISNTSREPATELQPVQILSIGHS